MRGLSILIVFFLLPVNSCSIQEPEDAAGHGTEPGSSEENVGEHEEEDDSASQNKTVYITGVEYPAYYDWISSVEPVGTEALIFLMSGENRILDFLAGEKYGVYADPRRHRCIKGHIYSDFNAGGRTIVKKDGETLFSFDTEETVVSWAVVEDDVFTLSVKRPAGISFRKNGALLYCSSSGKILSGLYEERRSVCFCIGVRTGEGESDAPLCIVEVYSDGARNRHICPEYIDNVFIAEQVDGKLAFVGYSPSDDEYLFFYDGKETVLERFLYDYIAELRFLRGKDKLFVYGELSDKNDNLCSPAVWTSEGLFFNFSVYDKCFSVCTDADTVYNFVGKQQFPQRISAYVNGSDKLYECGTGLSVYSDDASVFNDGRLYFIYGKSRPYIRPCLSVDGVETEYGFNGFFSGISVW